MHHLSRPFPPLVPPPFLRRQAIYGWWQYDLCDVFIELMKPVMALDESKDPGAAAHKAATRDTLWVCLETGLRWVSGTEGGKGVA